MSFWSALAIAALGYAAATVQSWLERRNSAKVRKEDREQALDDRKDERDQAIADRQAAEHRADVVAYRDRRRTVYAQALAAADVIFVSLHQSSAADPARMQEFSEKTTEAMLIGSEPAARAAGAVMRTILYLGSAADNQQHERFAELSAEFGQCREQLLQVARRDLLFVEDGIATTVAE